MCRLTAIRCSVGTIIIDILLNKNKNRIKHKGIISRAMSENLKENMSKLIIYQQKKKKKLRK
jgi:hypothetical protein